MLLKQLSVGVMGVNCYIIGNPDEAFVIDPGGSVEKIYAYITEQDLKVKYIVLTHCHFDHILAAEALKIKTNAQIVACEKEAENLKDGSINMTGRFSRTPLEIEADLYVTEGDVLSSGEFMFEVLETPGHTSGGMCLYCPSEKMLFSGDTLFRESVGRSDLPTGDYNTLIHTIESKLFLLPEDVRVFPGHESETTIGHELKHNPYIR